MTTYLRKRCSFGLPRVPFVNCRHFMYLVISRLVFEGRMWDLIVSAPGHCLSFYFVMHFTNMEQTCLDNIMLVVILNMQTLNSEFLSDFLWRTVL